MQAVRVHDFAKPPNSLSISLDVVPAPVLASNEHDRHVLVQVHFVGVQYPDTLQARGLYQVKPQLPYGKKGKGHHKFIVGPRLTLLFVCFYWKVPCMDCSGIVLEVGSKVNHVKPGDPVVVTCLDEGGTGAMAQQILISSKFVYRIPQPTSHSPRPTALPLETCSNIGRNYFAAFHSLKTIGEVGPHSLVLISGASGGVGMACIELAKAMGATVIAGVSTAEKAVWPPQVGADATLVYGKTKACFRQFKQQVDSSSAAR